MIIELLILIVALAIGLKYQSRRPTNFPPGPIGLPLLGHLPMLGSNPHKTLWEWKKTYGPIIGFWFGSYRSVVLNDTKLIREALSMNCFAGRPKFNHIIASRGGDGFVRGLIFSEGSLWTEQRRFTLKNLPDFGFGKQTMGAKVQDEIQELMKRLRAKEGQPIKANNLFISAVLNALWSIAFSERMKEDNPDSLAAFKGLAAIIDNTNFSGGLAVFVPWLAKLAPKLSGYEQMMEGYPSVFKSLRKQIANHNEHYVEDQPRDFLDAYLDEVRKTTDPNCSFHPNNDAMLYTLFDLFLAGSETASTTLSWICAYLINNPQVQKKLQDEIDEVVGRHRSPSLADRPSMPYAEAVINEALRFSSITPFAGFHQSTEDVEFHGFFIPKYTMIVANMYGIHFDETIWGDPQNFRPERFIDSNGKFKKNENLLPFSIGKRVCPGEGLGRDELFLFAVSLFQTFSASAVGKLPSLEPHQGFVLVPQPFEMILNKRI